MIKKIITLLFLVLSLNISAQEDTWVETNTGIADYSAGESFELNAFHVLENKRVLAFVNENSGATGNGVFELDSITWSWTKVAERISLSGQNNRTTVLNKVVVDGNRVFHIGRNATVHELNLSNGEWTEIFNLNINSNDLPQMIDESKADIVNGDLYLRIAGISGSRLELVAQEFPEENFQEDEVTIMKINLETGEYEFIRNPNNPLITAGGNSGMRILSTGEMYLLSTWDYRGKQGWGGLYEWNGTDWVSASAGLNLISTTNNFGPMHMGPTNPEKTRLFVQTDNGFYEKVPDGSGWFNYFTSIGGTFNITKSFVFAFNPRGGGDITQVDKAIKITHKANFSDCFSWMRHFFTPNDGKYYLIAPQQTFEFNDNTNSYECSSGNSGDSTSNLGIYRYVPTEGKPASVFNLHLENGTYLGGEGDNFAAEAAYTNDDKLLLAGVYNSNMGVTPTNLLAANNDSKGKLYVMNEWGTTLEQVINLGEGIYDMDVEETTGEIALLGDFGVVVLHSDYTLKWHVSENVNSDQEGSYRPRIAIAENGQVIASGITTTESVVRLYNADGSIQHTNNKLDVQARRVYDVEISSAVDHNQYYVCGFQQNEANWQSGYLHAYPLTTGDNPDRLWQTWGFSVGQTYGTETMTLGSYGADTRLYRIKVAGGSVYVAGESAGGGPDGFTIFACDGFELQTRIADKGNDFYTDGTISCGPCHISYLAVVRPSDGKALKGRFFHARRTNRETNTNRVKDGDLEVDEQGNVYLTARTSARFQDRDIFNVNGNLIQEYGGTDLTVLMVRPDFSTRVLWGAFPKANRGSGSYSRITARRGKTAFFATSNRGELITTENALQAEPYSIVRIENEDDTLRTDEVYLATWHRDVWEHANKDKIDRRFVSVEECFYPEAFSDLPCPIFPNGLEDGSNPLEAILPFNILTPNDDTINDEWRIDGINLLDNYNIKVFTKTGEVVYESNDYTTRVRSDSRWDGTNQSGTALPEGIYYYIIQDFGSGNVKTGYITLIR